MFGTLRCALALSIATATAASAQIVGANADSIPRHWVDGYFPHFDQAATTARLTPLREMHLRAGEREVRIWTQIEIGVPKHLYRFTERDGHVRGERIEYWSIDRHSFPDERPGETMHDLMLYSQKGRCDGFTTSAEMAICRVRFRREPPWGVVLRDAASHGLWTLPDPSVLPSDSLMMLDGWTMIVELRDGPRYRTYQYNNPDAHTKWPSASQANEIAHALSGIDSLTHLPDVWRIYRGVTTGRYRSAFRSCDGAEWEFYDELRSLTKRTPAGVWSNVPALADSIARDSTLYEVEVLGELTPEWLARRLESKFPRALQVMELRAVRSSPSGGCSPALTPARSGSASSSPAALPARPTH